MLSELDHGARCTAHAGEAFRVRCDDCDAAEEAERERRALVRERQLELTPNCSREVPCPRCIRELELA